MFTLLTDSREDPDLPSANSRTFWARRWPRKLELLACSHRSRTPARLLRGDVEDVFGHGDCCRGRREGREVDCRSREGGESETIGDHHILSGYLPPHSDFVAPKGRSPQTRVWAGGGAWADMKNGAGLSARPRQLQRPLARPRAFKWLPTDSRTFVCAIEQGSSNVSPKDLDSGA